MKPIRYENTSYWLQRDENSQQMMLCIDGESTEFSGRSINGIFHCPLTSDNASVLRERLPWLSPQPLGLKTSFGFGDRLGLATFGHIASVRGTGIAPIFAQQSVRENERTGRTPQIVLDDAMWAIFRADWRDAWGADADHVKEIDDLQLFIDAGYSFYTIDPNQYVDNDAQSDTMETLIFKVNNLPWDALQIAPSGLNQLYLSTPIRLGDSVLDIQEETLLRAAAKYGRAIAHIKSVSDYLVANVNQFDLEASVDETDTPTSVEEHYYIASELRRLDVPFVSLAPRFIGSFEKGVDYVGDLTAFEQELERHAAVMHAIGGYKLSIHTGSDKFSVYPSIAQYARNLVHVKTAGTSYLEALRVVASVDQPFFREILDFSREHYEADRVTYHVSATLEKVPSAVDLADNELLDLFEQFDTRQVLHVTFGSVLDMYGDHLIETIEANQILYEQYLSVHFAQHLKPFTKAK